MNYIWLFVFIILVPLLEKELKAHSHGLCAILPTKWAILWPESVVWQSYTWVFSSSNMEVKIGFKLIFTFKWRIHVQINIWCFFYMWFDEENWHSRSKWRKKHLSSLFFEKMEFVTKPALKSGGTNLCRLPINEIILDFSLSLSFPGLFFCIFSNNAIF
jgi:hypothetical protein